MKNKILPIILIMMLALVGSVLGASTFVTPTSSDRISGTLNFNVSTQTDFNSYTLANCTITATSVLDGNTKTIVLFNESIGNWNISNASVNTATTFNDSTDWGFTGTCTNGTANSTITAISGVTVDNRVPVAPYSLDPADASSITTPQTKTFTSTVYNNYTTACTYIIYRGSAGTDDPTNYFTGTATYSISTCSFTKEFSAGNTGTWTYTITASDGTNSTTSSATTFKNNIPTGGSGGSVGGGGVIVTTATPTASSGTTAVATAPQKSFIQWLIDIFKGIFKIK